MKNQSEKLIPVSSVAEAIGRGFRYVIAYKDHHPGNSKGNIYPCTPAFSGIDFNTFNERPITEMYGTNEDAPAVSLRRRRIIDLLRRIEFSTSDRSPLWKGTRREFAGHKMVFGTWRRTFRDVVQTGADNFNPNTFQTRRDKTVECLRRALRETDWISSSLSVITE